MSQPSIHVKEACRGARAAGLCATLVLGGLRAARADDESAGSFWSAAPLERPAIPEIAGGDWARNPIDVFVLDRLEEDGLTPAPRAEGYLLGRRLSFDLVGAAPEAFGLRPLDSEASSDEVSRYIDRLIQSTGFGEKWARRWMDLVRYSDSGGYNADEYRPRIWRYRDYLIDAFNTDKPYDRFVAEQLAGDELDPDSPEALVATGFLRLWPYESNQRDVDGQWNDILNEITDVVGEVFLSAGLQCARCHDHKFDPISQKDYFAFRSVFANILPDDSLRAMTAVEREMYEAQWAEWEAATREIRERIAALEAPAIARAERDARDKFDQRYQDLLDADPQSLSPYDFQIRDMAYRQLLLTHNRKATYIPKEWAEEWKALSDRLRELERLKPTVGLPVMAVRDVGPRAAMMKTPSNRIPEDITPTAPTALGGHPLTLEALTLGDSTGRRLALARWLRGPGEALMARVMANRIWQAYFGWGLARTPNDFGAQGEAPTHPELLDWLAVELIESGWSVKEMSRLIVNSATYQQSALRPGSVETQRKDPDNYHLWRARMRRLDGDELRDALLVASGELDWRMGGETSKDDDHRRSVYQRWMRNDRPEVMATFDGPDCFNSVPRREVTTSAPQALLLLNGAFARERAVALAARVRARADASRDARVTAVFRLALGREPQRREKELALAFLDALDSENLGGELDPLAELAHATLNSNAFIYLD